MMKCPRCEFEQIEESPNECGRCGILFEKWLDRQEQQEQQESYAAPAPAAAGAVEQWDSPQNPIYVYPPASAIWGTRFCQLGMLMITLPLVSFLINLIGFEFTLLLPLESFDNPTHAKFWTMGFGVVAIVIGSAMGGDIPDGD